MPHQCAHWFAMTCRRQKGVCACKDVARKVRGNMPGVSGGKALARNDTSPPVIARSEATGQSVSPAVGRRGEQYFGRIRESAYGFARSSARLLGFSAGMRIATPVCALARNDMQKTEAWLRVQGRPPTVIARSEATWQSVTPAAAQTEKQFFPANTEKLRICPKYY